MTRLNQMIRKQMTDKAIDISGLPEKNKEIIQRRKSLAEKIWVHSLGGEERISNIKKTIDKINKMLEKQDFNHVSFHRGKQLIPNKDYRINGLTLGANTYVTLYFNGLEYDHHDKRIYKQIMSYEILNFDANHPFTLEYESIISDCEKLKCHESDMRYEIIANLSQFSTVKKLLEAWPEAEELLPKDIGKPKSTLPAIHVKNLNTLIGLPT